MNRIVVKANIDKIRAGIVKACDRVGRNPEEITIIGVTKYTDINGIIDCVENGINNIGENKAQNAVAKIEALKDYQKNIEWHFIGHLQSNKIKMIIDDVSLIHSLDRYSLAADINKQAKKIGKVIQCLLQVNISGEQSKYGVAKKQAIELAKNIEELQHIKVVGLMTMAPYYENSEQARSVFSELRFLKEDIQQLQLKNHDYKHLSMGMSNDFEVAIEEGATMIRLGSIIFEGTT